MIRKGWMAFSIVLLFLTGFSAGCGQEPDRQGVDRSDTKPAVPGTDASEGDGHMQEAPGRESSVDGTAEAEPAGVPAEESGALQRDKEDEYRMRFGENCIADQTFEVEMSEFSGKVWFVPCAPSADGQEFRMQIIRDRNVLNEIPAYVPEELGGKKFASLDAVSFFDVNYDGSTDIVLIETYENTTFAAVYFGYREEEGAEAYFLPQDMLSANITAQAESLTVPGIREFLRGGYRGGDFSGYQEAWRSVSRLYQLGHTGATYDLTDIDGDDVPELVAGVNGYRVSLYAYRDGKVCVLMDDAAYGAMGNAGYEYAPGKNSIRNYNSDFAGAVLYTTYMAVGGDNRLGTVAQIVTYNFDDVNGNGVPDEEEQESLGRYSVSYMDGRVITDEEAAACEQGEYLWIQGRLGYEELLAELDGM